MSEKCIKYQQDLVDIFYKEKELYDELRLHLNNCEKCSKYWEELEHIKLGLKDIDIIPVDYMQISKAFEQADNIKERRKNIKSLIVFIIFSSIIMSIITLFAIKGYLSEILYFQMTTYMIIPLLLPIIIRKRYIREGYND
ncbi:hypothetical protein [Caloranaerobacter ferrireducens]|uniref:hypothetical protein n=1 Tax=Caloranaerobacter ferrireducens TaxID=1323370 RepID=UPI00084D5A05|nr:hypothetical protein [Caloranaerobacter ferrireducens]